MSDTLIDEEDLNEDQRESQDFIVKMTDHTRNIANLMSPGNPGAANKIFHHLILTQKLLSYKRSSGGGTSKDEEIFGSPKLNLLQCYMDCLPIEDMSSIIYWDQATLNEVDSEIIKTTYRNTINHYKAIY